jgi:uncharacterized RDD family membrane protein YckC
MASLLTIVVIVLIVGTVVSAGDTRRRRSPLAPRSTGASEPAAVEAPVRGPPTASVSRRLHAVAVDSLVLIAASALAFVTILLLEDVPRARASAVLAWQAGLLLYDPLLVWLTGATIGHRALNLRVCDHATGERLDPARAAARFVLKAFLGAISYVSMMRPRADRAIHDIWTRSRVEVRDPRRALPHHYSLDPD